MYYFEHLIIKYIIGYETDKDKSYLGVTSFGHLLLLDCCCFIFVVVCSFWTPDLVHHYFPSCSHWILLWAWGDELSEVVSHGYWL
jgi:hypothetical protein